MCMQLGLTSCSALIGKVRCLNQRDYSVFVTGFVKTCCFCHFKFLTVIFRLSYLYSQW